MNSIRDIANLAVAKKREGKFKEAIQLYQKALEIDDEDAIIYISLAKSLYLDNQRQNALDHYIIGLSLSIIDYANENGFAPSDVAKEKARVFLVENFFSTTSHLAHAYIDLDQNVLEHLAQNFAQSQSSLNIDQIRKIVNYTIADYRFVLAGGGVENQPKHHGIDHDLYILDNYSTNGKIMAMRMLNWEHISNSLSNG